MASPYQQQEWRSVASQVQCSSRPQPLVSSCYSWGYRHAARPANAPCGQPRAAYNGGSPPPMRAAAHLWRPWQAPHSGNLGQAGSPTPEPSNNRGDNNEKPLFDVDFRAGPVGGCCRGPVVRHVVEHQLVAELGSEQLDVQFAKP